MTIDPPPDDRIPELYADGVFDIGFGNGMVRIDLYSLSALRKDEGGQPLPAIRQRLVMSLPGFLASLAALDGMRQRLEDAGVLPPGAAGPAPASPLSSHGAAPAAPTPAQPASPSAPPVRSGPPRSPNFG
ncbi:hypothetical protein [Azospirillum sp. TSO35-2]|uniref:hypothetical protein n=1 Tax=Azospirillum sp. TSO35-2 TaxID=716796 RepID=UPI000D616874|nr:hypothetical protein [Azospirillum sp. TSO35-2]PWC40881.1 hypothetical protein TSO352_00010 [Azospirillum sp. TSO35-2]